MRRFLLPSVACPTLPCFSILSHKRYDFEERFIMNIKCVVILSTTFVETFLILRKTERDAIINVHKSSCKGHIILVRS
jgi:hypothetical protein